MINHIEKALSLTEIHKIIEFVSHTLKKPVILEDEQFYLLSYSSYYINDFDIANQQTILSKKCPMPILEKFIEDGILDQLQSITGPFRVRKIEEIGLNHRVVVSTQHKQVIMGYLWVQEIENPLSKQEVEFLHQISLHIGKILFKKSEAKREKNEKKGQFYRQLLNQSQNNDKQLKTQAEAINLVLPSIVLAIVFSMGTDEEEKFDSLKETVQSYLNVTTCMNELIVDTSKIVVILGDSPRNSSLATQATDLVNRIIRSFQQNYSTNVFIGIGNEYSISLLRKSFLEAVEVIKAAEFLGNQENIPFEFKKLGIYRYIQFLNQFNHEFQYANPELIKLKNKDEENQLELLKTLEAYLVNNCRAKQTAEHLYIHPNTLNYRIKQIMEYTNIEFTDFNMNCQLFIDILLLKSQK